MQHQQPSMMTLQSILPVAHLYKLLVVQQHFQDTEGAEPTAGIYLEGKQAIMSLGGQTAQRAIIEASGLACRNVDVVPARRF